MLVVGGVVAEVRNGQNMAKKIWPTHLERGQQGKAIRRCLGQDASWR